MNTNKLVPSIMITLITLASIALPAARAATLPISVKAFKCGSEESSIVWSSNGNTSNQGFGGSKLTAITVAYSFGGSPESVGVFAQLQQLPQPPSSATGFRKFSAFVQDFSAARESYSHAQVRFRFRLSDNSLFISTKNLTDLGISKADGFWQTINAQPSNFAKDVSSANLEDVAIYVNAGGSNGTKNFLQFGDITVETGQDTFRPSTVSVDKSLQAGCEAITEPGVGGPPPPPPPPPPGGHHHHH